MLRSQCESTNVHMPPKSGGRIKEHRICANKSLFLQLFVLKNMCMLERNSENLLLWDEALTLKKYNTT